MIILHTPFCREMNRESFGKKINSVRAKAVEKNYAILFLTPVIHIFNGKRKIIIRILYAWGYDFYHFLNCIFQTGC